MKRDIPKAMMLEILGDWRSTVLDEICDHSRWSVGHRLIFRLDGKLYESHYSIGATENQDERPWEYQEQVSCVEVEEKEKTITVYVPKNAGEVMEHPVVKEFLESQMHTIIVPEGWKYWYHNNAASMGEHFFQTKHGAVLCADYAGVRVVNHGTPYGLNLLDKDTVIVLDMAKGLHLYEKSIPSDEEHYE